MGVANRKINKSNFESIELFFREIKIYFISHNMETFQAATDKEINEFEKENNVVLSNELKKYFKIINGVDGALFISKLNPLSGLKKITEYDWFSNTNFAKDEIKMFEKAFILGDVMIDSHQWAIFLNENGNTEKIIEMDFERTIANSISDFLTIFVNENSYSLIGKENLSQL